MRRLSTVTALSATLVSAAVLYPAAHNAAQAASGSCSTKPYPDVPRSSVFCADIGWLKSRDITRGYQDGRFHPKASISRQEMAAYLFRLSDPGANDPGCSIKPYPDVPTSSTFCGDINWLTTKHVTKGYPDGNFHPNVSVARQEMAAFLHRLPGITFTFHGHGWGHGIGMSQWGAEGQALAGRNATKILNFYYPGTGGANIGNPRLRVQLRYMGGGPTVVRWSNGLRVYDMTPGHKHASVKLPKCPAKADTCGGLWAAQTYPTKNGPRMRLTYQTVADTAEVETYHFSGVLGPLRFGYGSATKWQAGTYVTVLPDHLSGNSARVYGGLIDATPVKGKCGKSACPMATVAQVPMEEYLRGVVPYEAIDSWKPAALQAQAVAARTYAEQARGNASYDHTHLAGQPHPWDICDTTACQVYDGNGLDGKTNSDAAIRATAGWIRTYDEHPISAMFSASNGGWTVQDPYGAPAPYLPAKKDPYDAAGGHNPWTKWSKKVSASMFAKHVPGHGRLVSLQITGRDGHGDWGGRVTTVALHFADGHTKTVSGGTIRGWAGLRSTWFTF